MANACCSSVAKDGLIPRRPFDPLMSEDDGDLYDDSLPKGETPEENGLVLKFIVAAVLVILVYGVATILIAAT